VNRDPDKLPSLTELGDRLGDAARREIASERRGRRFWRRPMVLLGIAGALVVAGGVSATDVFTGSGDPIPGEPGDSAAQPGVLTDSQAPDPAPGALPWALRVFTDDKGQECFQLGRLSGRTLGMVMAGQFHPFDDRPAGICGDLERDGMLVSFQARAQPAPRTIAYGLSSGRAPVTIEIDGRRRKVTPGALGAFVVVFEGLLDRGTARATTVVRGRRITLPPP
jgi:hypothetical protein